jgi:hypothetical protein
VAVESRGSAAVLVPLKAVLFSLVELVAGRLLSLIRAFEILVRPDLSEARV